MAPPVNANAVLCVKGEIHNVLTVLRLNSRWATRERFTREVPLQAESPLARAFKGLHSHLEEVDDLANVDTVRWERMRATCVRVCQVQGGVGIRKLDHREGWML